MPAAPEGGGVGGAPLPGVGEVGALTHDWLKEAPGLSKKKRLVRTFISISRLIGTAS